MIPTIVEQLGKMPQRAVSFLVLVDRILIVQLVSHAFLQHHVMKQIHSSVDRPLKMLAHLVQFLAISEEATSVPMVKDALRTLFVTRMDQTLSHLDHLSQFQRHRQTHISAGIVSTMHLRHVRTHAHLAYRMNVRMGYFALQVLHATIRAHFSAVLRGRKQRLLAPCLAKVV